MPWCCGAAAAARPGVAKQGVAECVLAAAAAFCPGDDHKATCALLAPSGALIAHAGPHAAVDEALLVRISLLKRATLTLGDRLGAACPAIRVKGESRLCVCYDVADHVLAVWVDLHVTTLALHDGAAVDAHMQTILQKLGLLLSSDV
eukprot:jgi/Chlat1/194/Chrsp1S03259